MSKRSIAKENNEALVSCLAALQAAESALTWADIYTDGKALNPAIYRIISMAKYKAEKELDAHSENSLGRTKSGQVGSVG